MSSQAGIFYYDSRPVPAATKDALLKAPGAGDRSETYESCGLFLAHSAFWIDDLAKSESQPHQSAAGNAIAFDGRLDNRADLLLRLRRALLGQRTDPACALAAYEAWGVEGLSNLIGDWSLALWDRARRKVILASDYAGTRPLYYHASPERVMWSSYLKPLVSLLGTTEIDDDFAAGFLTGCCPPARTPYRGIFSVPPGQALLFDASGVIAHPFWRLPVGNRIVYARPDQYEEQLRDLFRESVAARLRTSFPVCSELSGGWDSSSIVCMASHLISERSVAAPCITSLSFGPPGAPDEKFYTAVQRFCGIEGVALNTGDYPFLHPDYTDESSPAPWGALLHELSERARELRARVYFTGQGGDLMMGNWVDDSEQLAGLLRQRKFRGAFTEAVAWSKATRIPVPRLLWRGVRASFPANWPIASGYQVSPNGAIPEHWGDSLAKQFKARTGVADPDWLWPVLWKQAPPERRKHFRSVSRVFESGMFRPRERLQHLYCTHPYSHRPLVEFLLAIPPGILAGPGEPRRLMRRAFRELLPQEVATRRSKASFTGEFLKSLRPAAHTLLSDSRPLLTAERGYVDSKDVRQRLARMTQSLPCNEPQLRAIVLLELWLRARENKVAVDAPIGEPFTMAAIF
jgi:asparagine synthase (glutamine-hydrolysing)